MLSWWKLLFSSPPTCWFCLSPVGGHRWSSVWERVCSVCSKRLSPIHNPFCERCGRSLAGGEQPEEAPSKYGRCCSDCLTPLYPALTANRSVVSYTEWARELISLYKYRGREQLALPLGKMMAKVVLEQYPRPTVITFVPLHRERLLERGFNQAELLARVIAGDLHLPCKKLLMRKVATSPQSQRTRQERLFSMRGVFSRIPSGSADCERLLIVDDVYTTGATLGECATLLQAAGAQQVFAVTFAR